MLTNIARYSFYMKKISKAYLLSTHIKFFIADFSKKRRHIYNGKLCMESTICSLDDSLPTVI